MCSDNRAYHRERSTVLWRALAVLCLTLPRSISYTIQLVGIFPRTLGQQAWRGRAMLVPNRTSGVSGLGKQWLHPIDRPRHSYSPAPVQAGPVRHHKLGYSARNARQGSHRLFSATPPPVLPLPRWQKTASADSLHFAREGRMRSLVLECKS